MRRPFAALALAATLTLALAPAASATPREDSIPGLLSAFFSRFFSDWRSEPAGRPAPEAAVLPAGMCIDPWGRSVPDAPSCPLPPPAPLAAGVDEPEI